MISCANCGHPYPDTGWPYCCEVCGGIYDYAAWPAYDPAQIDVSQPGIWRYRFCFGLSADSLVISLGEGGTPLVWVEAFGRQMAFKCEYLNPTGSFKDRGSPLLVSFLKSRGTDMAVEDSSGNAGASFAAYAARGGIEARVFVPESASGPKRLQISAYGAELMPIRGVRSDAAQAVRQAAEQGSAYASHAYLPYNLPGYATLAYELVEQMGMAPGTVVLPVGQGGLLLGLARGFSALQQAAVIKRQPMLVGVQARACAPLWALAAYGPTGPSWMVEANTLAEGIRVHQPVRGDAILMLVDAGRVTLLAVDEETILPGRDELAKRGFYVEPTSGVVWGGLAQLDGRMQDPVVVILTGSGLKYAG